MAISQKVNNKKEYETMMQNLDRITDYSQKVSIHGNEIEGFAPTSYPCIVVVTSFELYENEIQVISYAYPKDYNSQTFLN